MAKRALFLAVLFIGGLTAANALAADKARFGLPIRLNPIFFLPPFAAEEKGFWKQNGLEVTWIAFESAPIMHRAATAGEVDVGVSSPSTVIPAIARGVPEIIIAQLKVANETYFWVRADSPVKEVKELKGKKVGVPTLLGFLHAVAIAVARQHGVEKDIKFVGAGGIVPSIAAVRAGSLDATMGAYPYLAPLKVKGEVREIAAVKDYLPKGWVDNVLFAHTGFATKNLEVVRRMVRAYFQAIDFMIDNPRWPVEKIKSELNTTEEVAKLVWASMNFGRGGTIVGAGLETSSNFLVEYGLLAKDKVPPLDKLFTTKFLQ